MNKPGLPSHSNFIRQIVESDLASGKYRSTIDREVNEGTGAGVMGTPTFFINGKRYNGPFELEAIKPIIDAELKAIAGPSAQQPLNR